MIIGLEISLPIELPSVLPPLPPAGTFRLPPTFAYSTRTPTHEYVYTLFPTGPCRRRVARSDAPIHFLPWNLASMLAEIRPY